MKTNLHARRILKLRGYFYCLVLLAMVGFAYRAGEHFASRIAEVSPPRLQINPAPSMSLDHLFAAAR